MLNSTRMAVVCLSALFGTLPAVADGRITKAVLGTDSTADFEVVNPATLFAPDTPQIVCVWQAEGVPPGSRVRGVWIAEETFGAAPPDFKIDEATLIASTSSKQFNKPGKFTMSRPTKGWPPGRYRVEIYLQNELAKTVRFSIEAKHPPTAGGARIVQAELGTGRTEALQIVNPATEFPPDTPQIVCAWKSEGVTPGTVLRAIWIAEDTGGVEPANSKILELSKVADASFDQSQRSGTFSASRPAKGWSPGRYRMEIYLGEKLAQTVRFTVMGKPAPEPVARITEAVLGTGRTETWEIVNPLTEFPSDTPRIVCVWRSRGLKPGTPVRDVWIAEDVGPSRPANRKIAERTTTSFTHGAFTLSSPDRGFRPGRYRLEIYLGDDLARTVTFTVKAR